MHRLLLKKDAPYEAKGIDDAVHDIAEWGMVVTNFPIEMPQAKALASNDWVDEDGIDEYVPANLPLQAYNQDITLCYTGPSGTGIPALTAFLHYLIYGGPFTYYWEHHRQGHTAVRYHSAQIKAQSLTQTTDTITFTITLQVNNPTHQAHLSL